MLAFHLRPGSDPDMDPPILNLLGRGGNQEQPEEVNLKPAQGVCVVCFDPVAEPCKLFPCGHENFHFVCIDRWLGCKPSCPICNATVAKVVHGQAGRQLTIEYPSHRRAPQAQAQGGPRVPIPNPNPQLSAVSRALNNFLQFGQTPDMPRTQQPRRNMPSDDDPAVLKFRREVYRLLRYSRHVGSSGDLTRDMFRSDADLKSRAATFLRCELGVFPWLTVPDVDDMLPVVGEKLVSFMVRKRSTAADRIITHIVQLLQHFGIKGSDGDLEGILAVHFGLHNAKLLLHALHEFLGSPYRSLEDWDRMVQYPDVPQQRGGGADEEDEGADRDRDLGPGRRGQDRYASNRYMDRYRARNDFTRSGPARPANNRPGGSPYETCGRSRTSNRSASAQGRSGRGDGRANRHDGHEGHGHDVHGHYSHEAPRVAGTVINLCHPAKR